jgi:hypothetical protein
MKDIRNIVDLTEVWSELTGEHSKTVGNRVIILRGAGILPNSHTTRRIPLTSEVVSFVLAMLATDNHQKSPDAVRACLALKPLEENDATALDGLALGDAIAECLRHERESGPVTVLMLTVTQSPRPEAVLMVQQDGSDPVFLHYGALWPEGEAPVWRIKHEASVSGAVLAALAKASDARRIRADLADKVDAYVAACAARETQDALQ